MSTGAKLSMCARQFDEAIDDMALAYKRALWIRRT
jgi:hypothetical protein